MLKRASGSEHLPEPIEFIFQNHDDMPVLVLSG